METSVSIERNSDKVKLASVKIEVGKHRTFIEAQAISTWPSIPSQLGFQVEMSL